MYIISWNINGLKQRFDELKQLIKDYRPDFVCLQKVRSKERDEYQIEGYRQLYNLYDIGNWSGVMVYARISSSGSSVLSMPKRIYPDYDLGKNGHMQAFDCKDFILFNAYVPFANKTIEGAEDYRREWDERFRLFVQEQSEKKAVVICGDLNIVHTPFDSCEKNIELNRPCFNPWERENFNLLLTECHLIDAYREIYPEDVIPTFYGNFRHLAIGNRIDYFLISDSLKSNLITSDILTRFGTGQSVPIILELDL